MNNTSRKNMLDDSMLVTLHKISHQIYIKHNELLLEHDITVQQSRVLIFIIMNRENGPISQKDIENHMCLKGSSVSSLIKTMIEKGLIIKKKSLEDGRFCSLDITKKGMELDAIALNILKEYGANLLVDISEDDINQTKKVLKLIEKNINK